jgi:hypothetical protein
VVEKGSEDPPRLIQLVRSHKVDLGSHEDIQNQTLVRVRHLALLEQVGNFENDDNDDDEDKKDDKTFNMHEDEWDDDDNENGHLYDTTSPMPRNFRQS